MRAWGGKSGSPTQRDTTGFPAASRSFVSAWSVTVPDGFMLSTIGFRSCHGGSEFAHFIICSCRRILANDDSSFRICSSELRLYLYSPKNRSKLSLLVLLTSLRMLSKPLVSIGVGDRPCSPRIRPVRWVTNWLPAANRSWSSQLISIIRQRSFSNTSKKRSHTSFLDSRTRSNIRGNPLHEYLPLSGPNIGCVQRMSLEAGEISFRTFFGWDLTDSTSTRRTFSSLSFGMARAMLSNDSIDMQKMITSRRDP
mmetsp:Transcript_31303/g.88182  ORF Transcript_31303/g.88182 Transcript_31303/m.88182 type:complete len:253 (-) Transcript_31303:141-899(-)